MPEGNAILDLGSGRFWIGIVPGGVAVYLAVNYDIVVTRLALPGTDRMAGARLQIFVVDRIAREIVIAFNDNRVVAFRDYCIAPDSSHSRESLNRES